MTNEFQYKGHTRRGVDFEMSKELGDPELLYKKLGTYC
jgi:hypothetical protein